MMMMMTTMNDEEKVHLAQKQGNKQLKIVIDNS
jgi:hypothetical protein